MLRSGTKRIPFPRVFYGWVIIGVSVVILLIVWGCQYSFGVFFKPLISEFGWTRASTSLAYSLYMVIHGLTQPVTGIIADRWGPRVPLLICGVGMGIGYFLMSRVTELWQLYLYYGVVIAISMTFAYVPIASTVTRWFTARRGLALGITATGVGLASAVMAPVAQGLISSFGWQRSYVILSSLLVFIVAPLSLMLVASPARKGLRPYGERDAAVAGGAPGRARPAAAMSVAHAARTGAFWLLTTAFAMFMLSDQLILVHIVPHVSDQGMPAAQAAGVLSLIGLSSVVGRIGSGLVSDRIGSKRTLTIVLSIVVAAVLSLVWIRDVGLFYAFAVVFGLGYGGSVPLHPAFIGQYFGLKHHGAIYGTQLVLVNFAAALGPYLAGYVYDVTGGYRLAFLAAAVAVLVGVIASALLRAPGEANRARRPD